MKFTNDQLKEFALAAGVPAVEIVADAKDSDYDKDAALQDVHKSVTAILKPQIEADTTAALEKSLKGKHSGEMYSILAAESGLTRAELEKLPVKEAAKRAFTAIVEKTGQDAVSVKQEIDTLVKTHNEAIAKLTQDKDSEISAARQRYVDRDMESFLLEQVVNKAPLLETADKSFYAQQLKAHLQAKYHLSYDEATKAVDLFKKDNTAIPALNAAGTGKISMLDEFKELATKAGVWKTDMRTNNPADAMQKRGQQGTKQEQTINTPRPNQRGKRLSSEDMAKHLEGIEQGQV